MEIFTSTETIVLTSLVGQRFKRTVVKVLVESSLEITLTVPLKIIKKTNYLISKEVYHEFLMFPFKILNGNFWIF